MKSGTDNQATEPERLLTLREIAVFAKVERKTVQLWRKKHDLVVVKLGDGTLRVRLSDWNDFVNRSAGVGLKSPCGGWETPEGRAAQLARIERAKTKKNQRTARK